MPLDPARLLAARLGPLPFRYAEKDVILYALSIGLGEDPLDPTQLRFVYEPDLAVFPTFGVLPAAAGLVPFLSLPGLDIDAARLVHGEHRLEVRARSLPTRGEIVTTGRVEGLYDKGTGALIVLTTETRTAGSDEVLFVNRASLFLRGEGGFGGDPGPPAANLPPERAPDRVVDLRTLPQQALLYRLHVDGDRNPLHADPDVARYAGFPRPILHGLCTFGVLARAVLRGVADNDASRLRSLAARFAGPLFPGETLRTSIWKEGTRCILKAEAVPRGAEVITHAAATVEP